jgi:hypothetical protein
MGGAGTPGGCQARITATRQQSRMSASGQKQTSRPEISMSALPPKADIVQHGGDVRFVPIADICTAEITGGSTNESARNVRSFLNCPNASRDQ